jgi:hypothetical protein
MKAVSRGVMATCVISVLLVSSVAWAQEAPKSADSAKALAALLDTGGQDSMAAADPANPGVFFGALYFPGLQLLVVSAKYSVPVLLEQRLEKKEYRDLYLDLMGASEPGTKEFFEDLGANGLVARPRDDEAADAYEKAGKRVSFDRDWKAQGLSEDDYMKVFGEADARYAQILEALLAQAKKGG